MTHNQIEYNKLREQQRTNRANEELTRARDATTRELGFANYGENVRHNLATERHNTAVLDETSRHNRATELTEQGKLREQTRHNQVTESVEVGKLNESYRHNVALETEANRHNLVSEADQARQTEISRYRADTERLSQLEVSRHNQAYELELHRSNVVREEETGRHNKASEQLSSRQIQLGYSELASLDKYRARQLQLSYDQLAELNRSNLADEGERKRSNKAREKETTRSNLRQEELKRQYQSYDKILRNKQLEISRYDAEQRAKNYQLINELGWYNAETEREAKYSEATRKALETGIRLLPIMIGG